MAVRSAAQVHLYFVLFLAFWRLNWAWKLVAGAALALLSVYYLPWPFEASEGALWVDALFSAVCAAISAALIPAADKGKSCKSCYFFCFVAIPVGVLSYASVYIPQTDFPLGIYISAMIALSLCAIQMVACSHAFTYIMFIPGSVFVWAMIAPNVRFLPVSLALAITVVVFAFRYEFNRTDREYPDSELEYASGGWSAHLSDDYQIYTSSEDEYPEYPKQRHSYVHEGAYRRNSQFGDDIELKLEF